VTTKIKISPGKMLDFYNPIKNGGGTWNPIKNGQLPSNIGFKQMFIHR
jgi:hypothetical protein